MLTHTHTYRQTTKNVTFGFSGPQNIYSQSKKQKQTNKQTKNQNTPIYVNTHYSREMKLVLVIGLL